MSHPVPNSFVSHRARRIRRDDPKQRMLQDHVLNLKDFIFPCELCALERSGREKMLLSLTEPAGTAKKKRIRDARFRIQLPGS